MSQRFDFCIWKPLLNSFLFTEERAIETSLHQLVEARDITDAFHVNAAEEAVFSLNASLERARQSLNSFARDEGHRRCSCRDRLGRARRPDESANL